MPSLFRLYATFFIAVAVMVNAVPISLAQEVTKPATESTEKEEAKPEPLIAAPYDNKLLRLSEVLGSIHYLRNLCGANDGTKWRDRMAQIIESEKPIPSRRARLTASFNRGYRAFDQTYGTCTPSALLAVNRYMREGVLLSSQITSRYGR